MFLSENNLNVFPLAISYSNKNEQRLGTLHCHLSAYSNFFAMTTQPTVRFLRFEVHHVTQEPRRLCKYKK